MLAPKGILFDLDGVLYVGNRVIDGAVETLRIVRDAGIRCRFLTNTSNQSAASLANRLCGLGIPLADGELLSSIGATRRFLLARPGKSCCLLLPDDVRQDFADLPQTAIEQADFIVLGDIGDALDRPLLNRVFNRLMAGGELIAAHKNRFWQTEEGLQIDIGAFVAGLEYCTGRPALIMGKPSPDFFRIALSDIGLDAAEVAVIGDDIDADIGGGQAAGLYGILTRTGKYREAVVAASAVRPDCIIDSIRDLPALLGLE